ncbi:hypothetical protein [Ideonella alba]|uniref:DUF2185 domain-containing protein n=1 Tax=Ideonella alba TaxID=2824118 RepID=A0A940YJR5_9BURK|nr:hypothetical protein [Ideonella alba]MBQ0933672.1 hypothetical protein [Ideonella alba]
MSHSNAFEESAWPFDAAINAASFTTKYVLDGSLPILEVYHDHDGDWQFMCGTTNASADAKVVCLGCMIDCDPTLVQLADLPEGWLAHRESPAQPWARESYEDSDAANEA